MGIAEAIAACASFEHSTTDPSPGRIGTPSSGPIGGQEVPGTISDGRSS